ncbi:modulator of macroautophagy TMEM150B isoform X1 [Bos taurus]|uniref:modulator of macroautophagy TMEM150B isoform X1 n=1 Tax=Bos taurus TaxID=9913 RepID=UPI000FC48392|nr:modulator of macroautophagy TMEM150B isoform X1 [Bos taurus]
MFSAGSPSPPTCSLAVGNWEASVGRIRAPGSRPGPAASRQKRHPAEWAPVGLGSHSLRRFSLAVVNKAVNLTDGFPYISVCGNVPPQSCIFSQVLNIGAASAAWICILRYYQLRDWGVRKWHNQVILWTGLLCALGTSIVGNFQEKNQRATHLTGAFLAFFVGIVYFWLQLFLSWRMKNLPQPGAPWIGPLRLVLCSACFILEVAMVVLHSWSMRSVSAICEWVAAMLLFILFGLLAVDFSRLDSCTLCLQPGSGSLRPPPDSPTSLHVQL